MTLPWVIAATALGLLSGPRMRASAFTRSTRPGRPPRMVCPRCAARLIPARWAWLSLLPVSGRCPSCRTRIGPAFMVVEATAGLCLGAVAARASVVGEFAAFAWLGLLGVPLAVVDITVRRLPSQLTSAAAVGVVALLAMTALVGHQPGSLARAVIGSAALACFYLAIHLIQPNGLGAGDVKLSVSIGAVLGWRSWAALIGGMLAAFVFAAAWAGVLIALHRADRKTAFPLGPFMLTGALAALIVLG